MTIVLRRTQRRQGVRNTIRGGNEKRIWRTHKLIHDDWKLEEFQIKILELIPGCPTKLWSTGNIIERFLDLCPNIASNRTIAEYSIAHRDYEVFSVIPDVLDLAHRTQELPSSDKLRLLQTSTDE
ncbi:hypothetical protein FRC09_012528, partial [Ceratobasidium sp. 395]